MNGFAAAREAARGTKVRIMVKERLRRQCRIIKEVQRRDKSANDIVVEY